GACRRLATTDAPQVEEEETGHMIQKYNARCACGSVTFEFNIDRTHLSSISIEPTSIAVCHCLDCKKASGGEAATFFGVPEVGMTLSSGTPKSFHYVAESGKGP